MKITTQDLRYLNNKDTFCKYAFRALEDQFDSRAKFDQYFSSIDGDVRKDKFLGTAASYLFLVKNGDWAVDDPDSDKIVDYLTNTYKYIGIFALIESLSDEKFIDFHQFLVMKKHQVEFPIPNKDSLSELYKVYKKEYGSIRSCIAFFKRLGPERQAALISCLKVEGNKPSIEKLAKFLYELRSKFVHEAAFILHMSDTALISRSGEKTVICRLSIKDAMTFFEEGLIEHFRCKA